MTDGLRPQVDERDLLFRRCRTELMGLLRDFRTRHALTPAEYMAVLAEQMQDEAHWRLRAERRASEPEGEA